MRTTSIAFLVSLLLLPAAACSKVHAPGSSGDDIDGGGGATDAAVPGPVTVTVLSFDGQRTPTPGIKVGFFAPDGGHQATVETDADGVATSDLEAGGAVIAFFGSPPAGVASQVARAVLAVEPGDQIVIGGEPFLTGDPVASMTVTLPVLSGAANYDLYSSCGTFGSGNNVVAISFYPGCDVDTFSFVAIASGDTGRNYLRHEDVAVVDGGNYDAPGSWQMMPTRPFLFTNVPDEAGTIDVGVQGVRAGDHRMDVSLARDALAADDVDTLTLRPERIPSYDETLISTLVRAEQPALGSFNYLRWLGPDDDTDSDLAALMLPWMGPVVYDSATRTISWRLVGDGEIDATYLTVITSINDGKTFTETLWFVEAPPGIESIVLPELPDDLSAWFLPDPQFVNAFGQILESDQIDGYHGARQRGFDPTYAPKSEPLGSLTRSSFSGSGVED